MTTSSHTIQATGLRKMVLLSVGTLSLMTGILGIFLPLLPTTCFLLIAAGCFSRSSQRFHHWLMTNRWFGRYLNDYKTGRGVPVGIKVVSVGSLWLSIGYVVLFLLSMIWLQTLLVLLAIGITYHVLSLPSRKETTQVAYGYNAGLD